MPEEPPSEPKDEPEPERGPTAADRRRVLTIALFVAGSLAVAVILAFFYAQPSTG